MIGEVLITYHFQLIIKPILWNFKNCNIQTFFFSKQDLLQNVIFFGFEKFEEKFSPIFQMKEKTVVERLYLVGIEYINFSIANPNLYRILFGEKFQEVRESNCDISEEENSEGFHALMKLLIEGQEAKLFNISNPMTQAQVIFSYVMVWPLYI